MTFTDINEKRREATKLYKDIRAIQDAAVAEKRDMTAEEKGKVDKMYADFVAIKTAVEAEERNLEAQGFLTEKPADKPKAESRDAINEFVEKRAMALSTNGDTSTSSKWFEVKPAKGTILSKVYQEYGATPGMNFPLFGVGFTNITNTTEDGTGATASGVTYAPVNVTPDPYLLEFPITDFLLKSVPAVQGRIQAAVPRWYNAVKAKSVVDTVFASTAMTQIECASSGAPVWADVVKAVEALEGYQPREELVILAHPTYVSSWISADTYGRYIKYDAAAGVYKFDGVSVIPDSNGLTSQDAGDVVCVVGNFMDYGIANADNLEFKLLDPVAGSLNYTVQVVGYFAGNVIVPSSFRQLEAKAAG